MHNSKSSRRAFIAKLGTGSLIFAINPHISKGLRQVYIANEKNIGHDNGIRKSNEKKFVPVMITPFTENGKIDFDALSHLIDFYLGAGAKGLFANCLSSEMFRLTEDERLALTAHVVKQVNGKVPVVASGSFGDTLEQKASFTKKIYQTGINAVILLTNQFAAKEESDEILIANFDRFLQLTPGIPVGTYECPSPYKRLLTPKVFEYLLSTNRIVYHKDTSLDVNQIRIKLQLAKNSKLELYDAHTPNAMYSLQMGAKGMSAIAGNFYPEIFVWMCDNANNASSKKDVEWLQSEITRVDSIISQGYPLSAKYFLQKRGIPLLTISRSGPLTLTPEQQTVLDDMQQVFHGWCQRLGIKLQEKVSK